MNARKPLIDEEGEVREITDEDMMQFRSAHEVLPDEAKAALGVRGAQKSATKERITIRLSPEVLEHFRSTGKGWQSRIDSALEQWIKSH